MITHILSLQHQIRLHSFEWQSKKQLLGHWLQNSVLTPRLYTVLLDHSVSVMANVFVCSLFYKGSAVILYALSPLISNLPLWKSDLWKFGKCGFLWIVLRLNQQHKVAHLRLNGCGFSSFFFSPLRKRQTSNNIP